MLAHLLLEVLARARVREVQAVLVHEHLLVLEPALPRLLRDALPQPLAELSRIGRKVESLGLAPELDALHHARHLELLHENLRAPIRVVAVPAPLRKPPRLRLDETALEEPVGRARREHEERLEPRGARLGFGECEEALAAPAVAVERVHRERRELRRLLLGVR